MEKQNKPVRRGGKKRQRKVSLPGTASEPKQMKLDLEDNNAKLKLSPSPEKNLKHIKPKKNNMKGLPEPLKKVTNGAASMATLNPKPVSANAITGHKKTKKSKLKNVDALTGSTTAINGSASSITESVKANPDITDAVIESNQSDELETSKNSKTKLKVNASNQKKSKSILALPKKKKKIQKGTEETQLKEEKVEASDDEDSEEPTKSVITNGQAGEVVSLEEIRNKFPILKDRAIVEKFLKVPMNNNQKGRIRQAIKLSLQGTSLTMFPDIINGKIQAILTSSANLTDSELRRIRILYNMLKTAVEAPAELTKISPKKKKEKKKKNEEGAVEAKDKKEKQEDTVVKVKGPKRYVVFLGNLPLDVNKEKIMEHFKELDELIKDVRIPKVAEGKKSAIAYVELSNEPSYELALSKHHSMMENRRIKVLYTTQQNSKISKKDAKGKSAKLIALQKSGKLVGSTPLAKKRSHRRALLKKAKANEADNA